MARELGFEPRLMEQGLRYLEEGHAQGIGDEDVCALYKLIKKN